MVFDFWSDRPSLEGEYPGESFFAKQGINAIGIRTARNDWYQSLEMEAVCAAVVAATPGQRRIGYGGSMGGYAAINFAAALDLAAVIAVCPQFSIDAARAPFETRWLKEAAGIDFCIDRIAEAPTRARGHVIYDPRTVDARHVALINAHHDLAELRIHFGGHDQMLMLQQCGLLAEILLDMVHERFDAGAALAAVRARRRDSEVFWLNLAPALAAHGRRAGMARALETARCLAARDASRTAHGFRWRFRDAMTDALQAAIQGHATRPDAV